MIIEVGITSTENLKKTEIIKKQKYPKLARILNEKTSMITDVYPLVLT